MGQPTTETFAKDVAKHEMTILHDDGLYRHITFGTPNSGIDRFNLTTFPGRLVFTGDRGDYLFERTDDMFTFFRRNDGGINERYWAEKCVAADRDGITKFSEDVFKQVIRDHLEDIEADAELKEAVEDDLLANTEELSNDTAHSVVHEYRDDRDRDRVFADEYEFDFTEYTYRFIWCLRAIVWGIAKYDSRN